MNCLFLFLDGIGLGSADDSVNPFSKASMPNIQTLLDGQRMLAGTSLPYHTEKASLLALDANLGVAGLPQSATGQAVLLTGVNVPAQLGYHYGPKPNPPVAEFLTNGNIFSQLIQLKKKVGFINAYPPGYFESIASGKRLYSAIPLAATSAGLELNNLESLRQGKAISADFTGQGWRDRLNQPDTPVITTHQAGQRLCELASAYDFTFFEYWLTDYAGHGQNMQQACEILEAVDQVIGGLAEAWDGKDGLVILTSDHGNMEDLSTRRHTSNPVPALLMGPLALRQQFSSGLFDLTGIAPRILQLLIG